ncbi:hypothetical protein T10_9400 [Trichinella papuae]|uniref:Uncharacterized protein n=1 Tax=Trichinella papuae TaxID=268474 RepID=A0A0V1N9V7_9BILA|nr:hypothetical protein T10_9400 [Trichinella papuae]
MFVLTTMASIISLVINSDHISKGALACLAELLGPCLPEYMLCALVRTFLDGSRLFHAQT